MVRFAVCCHPAQGFFKTRRYTLDKPGANNRFRTALEQCLTGVFAVEESGAAIRTAEGGAEHVQPITGDNIVNVLDDFRQAGYTVVTTSSEQGKPLFKTSLPAKMVLVLGQEYEGLPDAARDPNDLRVKIDGTGNVAGLNISVATGVLLGEWWRQNKA